MNTLSQTLTPSRVAAGLTAVAAVVAGAVGQSQNWDSNTVVSVVLAIAGLGYKWLDGRSKYETVSAQVDATK